MSKHINSLHVKNFRCLKDFRIDNFGDVNLLVGKNNSGKSTVLESIDLLFTINPLADLLNIAHRKHIILEKYFNPNMDFKILESLWFNYKISSDGKTTNKVILSNGYDLTRHFEYGTQNYKVVNDEYNRPIRVKDKFSAEIGSSPNDETICVFDNEQLIDSFDKINKPILDGHNYVASLKYKISHINTDNLIDTELLAILWEKYQLGDNCKEIIISALQIINQLIIDFAFSTYQEQENGKIINKKTIKVKLENKQVVPLKIMGDGVLKIFNIILNLYSCKNGILLIDEFENGLHFSVQKKLWEVIFKIAKDLNIQVFATTHSMDSVKTFAQVANEDDEMEGALFHITSFEGKVIANYYNEQELFDDVKMNLEVR